MRTNSALILSDESGLGRCAFLELLYKHEPQNNVTTVVLALLLVSPGNATSLYMSET